MESNQDPFPEILLRFARSFGDDALGHAREPLSADERRALEELAAGGLSDEQRQSLISLLSRNEEAVEFLAQQLKEA